ncbi:hypothetical protein BP6252_07547 [Coleophoma cylindrospora]|uniref:Cytochrome P450 n=1 Tax=Coleophoma cylindrospora TaxID=1849047 RepID=A0A3D8RAU7_9HELO|nr:hypothetical protein BP6252_07547 [Coleophoma cylindrospora]
MGNSMNVAPKLFQKYGDTVRVGPRDIIFNGKSAIQKIIVEDDLLKTPDMELVRDDINVASLISERDRTAYKQLRRLLSPGFSISYLKGLEPLMRDCVKEFEEVLDLKCSDSNGSTTIDICGMLSFLTSDVMSATSFGGSFGLVKSNDSHLKDLFINRMQKTAIFGQLPFLQYIPFFPGFDPALDILVNDIIAKRRAENGSKKRDLLQIFLDANQENPLSFTEAHIVEEMRLFMIAGSDTTSMQATFAILLLLNNEAKLKLLVEELYKAFPSRSDAITFANTQELEYLNAVINEAMRVMPIVTSGLPRVTSDAVVLNDYEIPPGTIVGAWISQLHKDPRIWPDAESFIPERWLHAYKGVEVDRKAFIPFSGGSRNCIGQQYVLHLFY